MIAKKRSLISHCFLILCPRAWLHWFSDTVLDCELQLAPTESPATEPLSGHAPISSAIYHWHNVSSPWDCKYVKLMKLFDPLPSLKFLDFFVSVMSHPSAFTFSCSCFIFFFHSVPLLFQQPQVTFKSRLPFGSFLSLHIFLPEADNCGTALCFLNCQPLDLCYSTSSNDLSFRGLLLPCFLHCHLHPWSMHLELFSVSGTLTKFCSLSLSEHPPSWTLKFPIIPRPSDVSSLYAHLWDDVSLVRSISTVPSLCFITAPLWYPRKHGGTVSRKWLGCKLYLSLPAMLVLTYFVLCVMWLITVILKIAMTDKALDKKISLTLFMPI